MTVRWPRFKIIFAALALLAGVLSWGAVYHNRERDQLAIAEAKLDRALADKRAIAADLTTQTEALADLQHRLEEARRRTTPDLGALKTALAPLHATLVREAGGAEALLPFTLTGTQGSTLTAALDVLAATGHLIDGRSVEVGEGGWSAELVGHVYVPEPPLPEAPPDPVPWYGFVNTSVRERIDRKKAELASLDQQLGRLVELPVLEDELDARAVMIDRFGQDRIDLLGLAGSLFGGPHPVFVTGRLERSPSAERGGLLGRLGRPMKDSELTALFGPELTVRIVRRYGDTVEIAFHR